MKFDSAYECQVLVCELLGIELDDAATNGATAKDFEQDPYMVLHRHWEDLVAGLPLLALDGLAARAYEIEDANDALNLLYEVQEMRHEV